MSVIEEADFTTYTPKTIAGETPPSQARRPRRADRARGRRANPSSSDMPWNVLTMLVWLLMAFVVMGFLSIHANPYMALNPFRPGEPTLAAVVVIPTATELINQPTILAPAAITTTPMPPTPEPAPTQTLEPTITATPGPSPTATIHSLYPFMQRGEVKAIDGATFHTDDACRLWVAGQAYDLQGAPMVGVTVMLGGSLDHKYINQLSLTGTALQYGQAGYEFTIAEHPIQANQAVWVQLYDQSMAPLSGRVFFDTYDNCSQNLILINFRQVR